MGVAMIVGPKQTILNAANNVTAATHTIGATDNVLTGDHGLPIRDTLGAIAIAMRVICVTPSTATILPATPFPCWDGAVGAVAAIPAIGVTAGFFPTGAVAMSSATVAARGIAMAYFFTDGNVLIPCPAPNLFARIVVASATAAGLTIEAKVMRADALQDLSLAVTPSGASYSALAWAW
jgi:hypothetical protein